MDKRDLNAGTGLKEALFAAIEREFDTDPGSATEEQVYYALCREVKNRLSALRSRTNQKIRDTRAKQVY